MAQTRTEAGCPFDCGLCPDHEQHSGLAIIEINQACNFACPVCFADATDIRGSHRPLAEIERMLDALVESEGEPDLVQLSGGEPTIHALMNLQSSGPRRPAGQVRPTGRLIAERIEDGEVCFIAESAARHEADAAVARQYCAAPPSTSSSAPLT